MVTVIGAVILLQTTSSLNGIKPIGSVDKIHHLSVPIGSSVSIDEKGFAFKRKTKSSFSRFNPKPNETNSNASANVTGSFSLKTKSSMKGLISLKNDVILQSRRLRFMAQ